MIGSGEAARSFPFEVVARTNHAGGPNPETCISLDFPGAPTEIGTSTCLTRHGVTEDLNSYAEHVNVYAAPAKFAPESQLIVEAVVPVDATVTLDYTTTSGQTHSAGIYQADLDGELAGSIDVEDRASFIFSVLPEGMLEGENGSQTLTDASVRDALSRIHYSVVDSSGATVVDRPLFEEGLDLHAQLGATSLLLVAPPKGFESDGGPIPPPGENPPLEPVAPE